MDGSVDDSHGGFDGPLYLPLRAEGVSDGALGDALGVVNVYETSEEIDGPFPLIGLATSVLAVSYHRFRQKGRVDGKPPQRSRSHEIDSRACSIISG